MTRFSTRLLPVFTVLEQAETTQEAAPNHLAAYGGEGGSETRRLFPALPSATVWARGGVWPAAPVPLSAPSQSNNSSSLPLEQTRQGASRPTS